MSSMDGEISSMYGEISSMDGEMSSMDESVIGGCHQWMTSTDGDDGHGQSIRQDKAHLYKDNTCKTSTTTVNICSARRGI